jgi:hypothetical protein
MGSTHRTNRGRIDLRVVAAVATCALGIGAALATCGPSSREAAPATDAGGTSYSHAVARPEPGRTQTLATPPRGRRVHAPPAEDPTAAPDDAPTEAPAEARSIQEAARVLQIRVYEKMERLLDAKAAERPDMTGAPRDPSSGAAAKGTCAAARAWLARELPRALWEAASADLGLSKDEIEKCWKERPGRELRSASYGTGTFVVARRNRASAQSDPATQDADETPEPILTDEEWWFAAASTDRRQWLVAFFVESSGMYEITRVSQEPCATCAGNGSLDPAAPGGAPRRRACPQCNGAGAFRRVEYR